MTDQVAQQGAVVEKGAGVPQDARVLDGGMGSKAPDVAAIHALVTACEALGKEAASATRVRKRIAGSATGTPRWPSTCASWTGTC